MEPARKFDRHPLDRQMYGEPQHGVDEGEREIPEWEIKLGKVIFYLTVAMSVWFFYWLNGIQCPC